MIKKLSIILFVFFIFTGCQTTSLKKTDSFSKKKESYKDVKSSIESVAEGVAGEKLSEKELKDFERDLRTNPETQSAVEAIKGAITKEKLLIKYCPVCGKRFSPDIEYCPDDKAKLKFLE